MGRKAGCDLRKTCGFYCRFVNGRSELMQKMIENYCRGDRYPLCARRLYYQRTSNCAPADVLPVGILGAEMQLTASPPAAG